MDKIEWNGILVTCYICQNVSMRWDKGILPRHLPKDRDKLLGWEDRQ